VFSKRPEHPTIGRQTLLLCWLLLGNPYPLLESRTVPLDLSLANISSQSSPLSVPVSSSSSPAPSGSPSSVVTPSIPEAVPMISERGCKSGYDSHYTVVSTTSKPYLPCKQDGKEKLDEVVIFNSFQILPRYILTFQCFLPTILWLDNKPENNAEMVFRLHQLEYQIVQLEDTKSLLRWMSIEDHKNFQHCSRNLFRIVCKKELLLDEVGEIGEKSLYFIVRNVENWKQVPILVYATASAKVDSFLWRPEEFLFTCKDEQVLESFCKMQPLPVSYL